MPAVAGMPLPDDLGRAPLWALYVNRQVVQASLGRLPDGLLALGVRVDRLEVALRVQLLEMSDAALADLDEIEQDLDMLTGFVLEITREVEILERRDASGADGTWWIYLDHDES